MIPLIRVYESEQQANSAVAQITSHDDITINSDYVVVHSSASVADPAASRAWGVDGMPTVFRKFFAEQAAMGRAIVAAAPPYGQGQLIKRVLNKNNPIEIELPEVIRSEPAPLSDWLGLPVLSNKKPNVRLITVSPDVSFGFGLLSSNATPLSSKFGLKVLKDGPGNSSFGFPLLSASQRSGDRSFGFPLLSKPKRPWNKSFGLPLLTGKSS